MFSLFVHSVLILNMTEFNPSYLLNAAAYALLGVVLFALCFWILDKSLPQPLWKEIIDEQNVAMAVLVAALALGAAIIIASAFH